LQKEILMEVLFIWIINFRKKQLFSLLLYSFLF